MSLHHLVPEFNDSLSILYNIDQARTGPNAFFCTFIRTNRTQTGPASSASPNLSISYGRSRHFLLIPLLAFPQKHMLSSKTTIQKTSLSESLRMKMLFVSYFCMISSIALKKLM